MFESGHQLPGNGAEQRCFGADGSGVAKRLLAGLLVACVASVAGGLLLSIDRGQADAAARSRSAHLAAGLAPFVRRSLEEGDLVGLRAGLSETADKLELSSATLELPTGRILWSLDSAETDNSPIPDSWPRTDGHLIAPGGAGSAAVVVDVPNRGSVVLQVHAGPSREPAGPEWLATVALSAVSLTLAALLIRRLIGAIAPLFAVASALRSASAGERDGGALAIDCRWGEIAEGWNRILADREQIRAELLVENADRVARSSDGSDGLLRPACDTMAHGVLVVDRTGCVRYANGAAGLLLRRGRQRLIGERLGDVISDESLMACVEEVASATGRRRASIQLDQSTGDNPTVLRCSISRVASKDLDAALVEVEDVTQQRVADKARDTFVTQATHELRTPLTNIRLYLDSVLEEGDADAATREQAFNIISQEARRLERMVSDMLSVAEIEAGTLKIRPGDVRLDQLFSELFEDYRAAAAQKDISLKFNLPPKLPVIHADRDKISLSIHNLIANALKYTPAGGHVVVSFEETPSALLVRVTDDGIGIVPDERERIFERFYRSSDPRTAKVPGSGLGLALAREVIRLHGGDVTVESEPDRGSTFTISLPKLQRAA